MADEVPLGRRFSHHYMVPAEKLPDSMTMRKRIHRTFCDYCGSEPEIGTFLELEMGIDLVVEGSLSAYTDWRVFEDCKISHLLDAITLIGRSMNLRYGDRAIRYREQISRILLEEHAAYRLDEYCGVHPMIDMAHFSALNAAIRHLDGPQFSAARTHIARADHSLLPENNKRESVRAIFDAAENVFKLTFKGAISLNKDNIERHLKPALRRLYVEGAPLRAAQKMADALQHWADGCHNYRHEPGHAEEIAPPEPLVVVAVAQGLGFVRWLADINREVARSG